MKRLALARLRATERRLRIGRYDYEEQPPAVLLETLRLLNMHPRRGAPRADR